MSGDMSTGLAKQTVYLAGPINACTDAEAKDWREQVKAELANEYNFLDPMARDYRGKEALAYKEIVRGDKGDIECSNLLVAYCPKPSYGTAMEIIFAFWLGKRVIVVLPPELPVSPWVRYHATEILPTIVEAINYLRAERARAVASTARD